MNRRDLQFLQAQQEYPSVSITVKTHRAMPECLQDPIRIKNAIAEVKKRLKQECGTQDLKKIYHNLDAIAAAIDYTQLFETLALFVNKDIAQLYKLPIQVEDSVTIDSTFEVRTIIHALNRIPRYWVVMLSEETTRLYYGVGDTLEEIIEPATDHLGQDQDGFPYNYLPADVEQKEPTEGYVERRAPNMTLGSATYVDDKYITEQKKKFFERVDELLSRFTSIERLPIILVGDERNCAFFQRVAPDQNVIACVDGDYSHNPSSHDLAGRVWPKIEQHIQEQCKQKIEEFSEAMGRMQHAFGIDAVWRVAQEGRVHDLLVEENFAVPGIVNPDNEQDLIIYDNSKKSGISDDLVNLLIERVMDRGGSITFCPPGSLKEYDHIAAILRY